MSTTLINNKVQMQHLFAAWKIATGTPVLPERKGAQPVYLRLDAPTLNLVKVENIGKGLYRVTMKTETVPVVHDDSEDDQPMRIPCCLCGKPTTRDEVYGDLCYRCCRADNE